jgi:cytochrome P450
LINQLCDDLVTGAVDLGRIEAVSELAIPLPVQVIARMLGVPVEDRGRFHRWSRTSMEALELNMNVRSLAPFARSMVAIIRLHNYLQIRIAERRDQPADDIISRLVAREGERLTSDEVFWFAYLLLVAGNETTTNLLSGLLLTFAQQPELYQELRTNPDLIAPVVEEQPRLYSPIQGFYRTALADYDVDGHTIPEGARVLVLFAAANRDPDQFVAPETFRLDRNSSDHLAFGAGIHYCLGAYLSKLEAHRVLEQLIHHIQRIELDGPHQWNRHPTVRALTHLPLRLVRA